MSSTDTFTASNGIRIPRDERGLPTLSIGNHTETQALREFFQHERDEELGRVRWPENPDIVVYSEDFEGVVRVVNEVGGSAQKYRRDQAIHHLRSPLAEAAKWWFDQNPTKCDSEFCLPTSFKECFPCTLDAHEKGDHKHEGDGFTLWWG